MKKQALCRVIGSRSDVCGWFCHLCVFLFIIDFSLSGFCTQRLFSSVLKSSLFGSESAAPLFKGRTLQTKPLIFTQIVIGFVSLTPVHGESRGKHTFKCLLDRFRLQISVHIFIVHTLRLAEGFVYIKVTWFYATFHS